MIKIRSTQKRPDGTCPLFKVELRGAYAKIKTTKQFLRSLDTAIAHYESKKGWEGYGKALRKYFDAKDYFYIARQFGIIGGKTEINE